VVVAVPLAGIEVEGREVPGAEVPAPLEAGVTMGGETVSIQGRAGNKLEETSHLQHSILYSMIRPFPPRQGSLL